LQKGLTFEGSQVRGRRGGQVQKRAANQWDRVKVPLAMLVLRCKD